MRLVLTAWSTCGSPEASGSSAAAAVAGWLPSDVRIDWSRIRESPLLPALRSIIRRRFRYHLGVIFLLTLCLNRRLRHVSLCFATGFAGIAECRKGVRIPVHRCRQNRLSISRRKINLHKAASIADHDLTQEFLSLRRLRDLAGFPL